MHSSGGGMRGGGFSHGGFAGHRGFDGDHFHRGFHRGFGGDPFAFSGLGLGFALGLNDPWYYDGPYYGYYPAPRQAYGYAPPAVACGSWSWDAPRQAYNWVPC